MKIKKMIFVSLFSAILCILSPISFPIGTVPVTLSIFALFITALVLPDYDAVTSTIIYLLLGLIGLPVFSGFKGGLSIIFGATGGFLWAYPFMAFIISLVKSKNRVAALALSLVLCYITGMLQLSFVTGIALSSALLTGVLPFIPFDIIKLVLALFISKPLQKACASFYKLG